MGSSGQRHNRPSHFLLSPPPSEYRIRARTPGHCALRVLLLGEVRARAELGTGHYTGQVRLLVLQCYISTASQLQGWTFRLETHTRTIPTIHNYKSILIILFEYDNLQRTQLST